MLDEAVTGLDRIQWPGAKVLIVNMVAYEYAKRKEMDLARKSFQAANQFAGQVELLERPGMLRRVAGMEVEVGMTKEATDTFHAAVIAAASLKAADRWNDLTVIAGTEAKAGLTKEAAETFIAAVAAAAELKPAERWNALAFIAAVRAYVGMTKESTLDFAAVQAMAAQIGKVTERAKALFAIAVAQQALGLSDEALATLHKINAAKLADDDPSSASTIGVFEVMVRANLKQFDEAAAKGRQLPKQFCRGALLYVAAKQIEAGGLEPGRRLWNEAIKMEGPQYPGKWFNEKCYPDCETWPKDFLNCEPTPLLSTLVTMTLAKAGLFAEALTTARLLAYDDDYADALAKIATVQLEANQADRPLATIEVAKAAANKVDVGETKMNMLLSIAGVEAKAKAFAQAHRTFATAIDCSQSVLGRHYLPGCCSSGVASLIKDELDAGFIDEAAAHCQTMVDSEDKKALWHDIQREIGRRQKDERARTEVGKALHDPNVFASLADEPSIQVELIRSMARAGRFAEALVAARTVKGDQNRAWAFSNVAFAQSTAKKTGELREIIGEWFRCACRIHDLASRESNLRQITQYQGELGAVQALQQTIRERLRGAAQAESQCARPSFQCFSASGSVYADIAADQLKFCTVGDSLETVRKVQGVAFAIRGPPRTLSPCQRRKQE